MSLQDKLERVLRDLHILIARGETIPGRENKVIIDKKQAAVLLNHLNETVFEMMEEYQVTADSREQALREKKKEAGKMIRDAEVQAEDIYAASVIYTDEAIERLMEIYDKAGESVKKVMEDMAREIKEEKLEIGRNQIELKSELEELKDTAKYVRIIEAKNRERAHAKSERELKRKGYYLGTRRESELSELEKELLKEQKEKEKEEKEKAKQNSNSAEDSKEKTPANTENTSQSIDTDDEPIVYEKPTIHINEEYFIKAGIPFEKEEKEEKNEEKKDTEAETKKGPDEIKKIIDEGKINAEDGEIHIDPETEKKLMEDLDAEYFDWQNKDGEQKPEKKGLRAFLDRWEKP
ncbi:MAG: hypothetical protein K6E13_00750 [Lachnospiraceae bacterium]|nr:hypothetical protein [Lachnospiraceae bacterium]